MSPAKAKSKPAREPFPAREDGDVAPARRSLTLRVDEKGRPQWDKLSEKTRDGWRIVLSDPATAETFGLAPKPAEEGKPPEPFISEQVCGEIYDRLGEVETWLFSRLYGLEWDEVKAICAYTPEEKANLVPPTQRILEKRGPEFLKKFQDEISLSVLLLGASARRFAACRFLAAMKGPQKEGEREKSESESGEGSEEGSPVPRIAYAQ